MLRSRFLALTLSVVLAGGSFAAGFLATRQFANFQSASAGVPVAFSTVPLPPVKTGAILPMLPDAFAPTQQQLLNGNTVITTAAQMKAVWTRLFKGPYDASLFDFSSDFVVLMGNGAMVLGSFDITAVESVDAQYTSALGLGGTETQTFLTVIGTTFTPGIEPQDPPPATYRVSAVRISKANFDDIVFHRNLLMGI